MTRKQIVLVVVSAVAVVGLLILLLRGQNQCKDQAGALSNRLALVSQEIKRSMSGLEQSNLEMQNAFRGQTAKAIDQTMVDLKTTAAARLTESIGRMEDQIRSANDRRVLGLTTSAQVARDRAKALIATGQFDLAKVYLLNAINHAPENAEVVEDYVKLSLDHDADSMENLNQVLTVLQLSAYQVPPEKVELIMGLADRISQARQRAMAKATAENPPTNWAEEIKRLLDVEPDEIYSKAADLQRQIDLLTAAITNLRENGTKEDLVLAERGEHELARCQAIQATIKQADYIDACLAKLSGDVTPDSDAAVAIIRAAESPQPQFWSLDLRSLPTALRERVLGYPKLIAQEVEKIAEARSRPVLEQVKTYLSEAQKAQGKLEDQKQRIREEMRKAQNALRNITSTQVRERAEETMQQLEELYQTAAKNQYNAYQQWALERCKRANNAYDNSSSKILPSGKDERNRGIFYDNDLHLIDPALLSPEVNRVYNDVVTKLFTNMSPASQVDAVATIHLKKKSLEEF